MNEKINNVGHDNIGETSVKPKVYVVFILQICCEVIGAMTSDYYDINVYRCRCIAYVSVPD